MVDLLVSDLENDRPKLEQQVPKLLKQLVDAGQLMAVETEYRLRTREGAITGMELWRHKLPFGGFAPLGQRFHARGRLDVHPGLFEEPRA
jgi:hypothetical protein